MRSIDSNVECEEISIPETMLISCHDEYVSYFHATKNQKGNHKKL